MARPLCCCWAQPWTVSWSQKPGRRRRPTAQPTPGSGDGDRAHHWCASSSFGSPRSGRLAPVSCRPARARPILPLAPVQAAPARAHAGGARAMSGPERPAPYVFLSYARKDQQRAEYVAEQLTAAGVRVWMDRQAIAGGASWASQIVEAIKGCAVLVLLVSEA